MRAMMTGVPDALFEHPRLAGIYDALDADRNDLDAYAAIVEELGARRILDLGCGTGTFAVMLAARWPIGLRVSWSRRRRPGRRHCHRCRRARRCAAVLPAKRR
jgi:SAM-dependent methyltransferase